MLRKITDRYGKEFDLHKNPFFKKNFDRPRRYSKKTLVASKKLAGVVPDFIGTGCPSSSFALFFFATCFAHK